MHMRRHRPSDGTFTFRTPMCLAYVGTEYTIASADSGIDETTCRPIIYLDGGRVRKEWLVTEYYVNGVWERLSRRPLAWDGSPIIPTNGPAF